MAKPRLTGMMRPLAATLAGILLFYYFGHGGTWIGLTAAFCVLSFVAAWYVTLRKPNWKARAWTGWLGLAAIFYLSFFASFLKNSPKTLPIPAATVTHYKVTLVKAVALKPTSVSSVGRVEAVRDSLGNWHAADGQVAIFLPYSPEADALQYGQQLLIKGALTPPAKPANPFQFDYRRYLTLKHIQWQAYLPMGSWQVIGISPPSALVAISLQVRKTLEAAFKTNINTKREATIANALVLGIQDNLDASLRDAYARTGTMHVLAVSGLHVGLLYGVLLFFLKHLRRGRKSRLVIFLFIVGVVWFYAFVTGLSASVLRSVCMFSLVELGLLLRRKSSVLNTLAAVAMVLLLYDPNFLFDVGFQLSFLAVAGIVLLQPLFLKLWYPERKLVRWTWELFAISIAAQMATFPLSLYYFHQFPVYFWVGNLLAVPLTSLGLYIGVAFMLLFWLPYLNAFIGFVLKWTLWCLNEFLLWVEQWPYSVLDGFVITTGQVLALYIFMIGIVLFLVYRKLSWLGLAAVCLAFVSTTEIVEARHHCQTQELILYSTRKSSAVGILQGRRALLFADSAFHAQPKNFTYNIQPHWWAKGIQEKHRFWPDFWKTSQKRELAIHETADGNRLLIWQGKRILWLQKLPRKLAQPIQVDVLVLQKNAWASPAQLQEAFDCRYVVLDQTNAPWYVQRKTQELQVAGYQVYDLEREGAWTIRVR
ncbi:ComEC/Rec2 family competence protein [Rufibacter sp. DG15C]|uniref:ComEC/Rec2 family competence protein n=1 Tax=Rufibacter sp. DG15C TaxID=1379909 RepID=UPI000830E3A2|nr:ComEC/Rec2 family competence protein [Rufibacter sp. DG15C]